MSETVEVKNNYRIKVKVVRDCLIKVFNATLTATSEEDACHKVRKECHSGGMRVLEIISVTLLNLNENVENSNGCLNKEQH